MSSIERIVIVGAGLAAARAAEALRLDGYEGSITIFGDEPERPYLRPPLSKEYLRGEIDREGIYVHPATYYEEHRIAIRPSTAVTAIEPASREVVLDRGERVPYDRLLIATGARARTLAVPGADLPGVLTLRTAADADAMRAAVAEAERVVVVGAGWIGSEVAASLRALGRSVVLVAPGAVPLERVLGREIGGVYRDLHVQHGVDWRPGTTVGRIIGSDHVRGIETVSGERLAADLVVVGVGVQPRTGLAVAAGIEVSDGVAVSPTLETTVPGVFAAGDVASAWHPFYDQRVRAEHWANAKFQGAAAGRSMLGGTAPYDRIPYFYSDQYDLGMEYTGSASASDQLVVRGSLAERTFIAFWLRDGRVVAGMNANIWDVAKSIERLIRSRAVVHPDALADPACSIDEVASIAPA